MGAEEDVLYREIILENWRHPTNRGAVANPDFDVERDNPLCGDHIRLTGKIGDGRLADIAFTGEGCAVSIASASLLTEALKGREIAEIRKLSEQDAIDLLGIQPAPARTKCALLVYNVLMDALRASANSDF